MNARCVSSSGEASEVVRAVDSNKYVNDANKCTPLLPFTAKSRRTPYAVEPPSQDKTHGWTNSKRLAQGTSSKAQQSAVVFFALVFFSLSFPIVFSRPYRLQFVPHRTLVLVHCPSWLLTFAEHGGSSNGVDSLWGFQRFRGPLETLPINVIAPCGARKELRRFGIAYLLYAWQRIRLGFGCVVGWTLNSRIVGCNLDFWRRPLAVDTVDILLVQMVDHLPFIDDGL